MVNQSSSSHKRVLDCLPVKPSIQKSATEVPGERPHKRGSSSNHTSGVIIRSQTEFNHHKTKTGDGRKNCLANERAWRGIIEVVEFGRIRFSEKMSARLSAKVSRKAFDFSMRYLEPKLEFKLHPRSDFYPRIFEEACPDRDDIALYIFPIKDDTRSKDQYSQLLKDMNNKDLMMRACINDRELLVYPSTILMADSQTLDNNFFMWGVFCPRKDEI